MKNAQDVLHQKETDLVRLRREIDSLKIVASLLADDPNPDEPGHETLSAELRAINLRPDLLDGIAENGLFSSVRLSRSKLWRVLRRAG
jgi:hypothetical protein